MTSTPVHNQPSHRPSNAPTIALEPVSADGDIGGLARITISSTPESLTGFADAIAGSLKLSSTIEFPLERPLSGEAQWWRAGAGGEHTCGTP